jgi:hypothetical protein
MNKKVVTILSVLVIVVFIGYMILDVSKPEGPAPVEGINFNAKIADAWMISKELAISEGALKAVAASSDGRIYLGGDSFVSCYDNDQNLLWNTKTDSAVTSISVSGDTLFAATREHILVLSQAGKILNEWGPFEEGCLITSVSSNTNFVAIADAGNKIVFILDKGGEVKRMIGQSEREFIIPSPYFDIAIDKDNLLYTANTGKHRIETRTPEGSIKSFFGEAGAAPEYFSGCCAPAHFIVLPDGFVTAEKGINRIKILNSKGEFVEFVNSRNTFQKSVPLDLASYDGKTIYAANPADSKLYVFKRK